MASTAAGTELGTAFVQQPHSAYDWLREQGPARQVILPRGTKGWVVTRYSDVRALLADPRLSKSSERTAELFERHATREDRAPGAAMPALATHMLNSDPPDHTRLRKLVNKAFTARAVEGLRPRIEQITARLLDEMPERACRDGEVDLLDTLAYPLPITVICELLGVPDGDRDEFRGWSNTLLSSAGTQELNEASAQMTGYLTELIEGKRADPGDDLLSGLIRAREVDDRLTRGELLSTAFLLLVAGHETTVNLIGNGMLALLNHPDQLAVLRADPDSLPQAVDELLRFDGPLNLATLRHTTEPVDVGEVRIPSGEFVLLSLLSANRDPQRFTAPHTLDVTRQPAGHVAFGHGIHYCLGAPLARMEGEVAIGELLRRYPDLTLAGRPETLRWRDSTLIHGLEELPVRLPAHAVDRSSGVTSPPG